MSEKLNKKVYITAGYNSISLGSGRKEFHPKKTRPGIDDYIVEAGKGVIEQINDTQNIDDTVVANFMASRFVKQANLAAFVPQIDPKLLYKPAIRVEGACCSGGLGLATSFKNILSGLSDVSMTIGVEVQNSVKAIYCADILAGASYYEGFRKDGHAYFFPNIFSIKAGEYFKKYGQEKTREAMARWYENAVLNARKCPKAQEYHNTSENLFEIGMTPPNPRGFLEHLNVFDCSKVSDGGSALLMVSEEGMKKLGKTPQDCIEVIGYGHSVGNITKSVEDQTVLWTTQNAVEKALKMAGITPKDVGVLECHDCFTITGLLALEACGFAEPGGAPEYVLAGNIKTEGILPTNTSGGLVGFGHYTGGTGVRQAVDILKQFTNTADTYQVKIDENKPYGLMISMGGDDKTVVSFVFKKVE